MSAFLDRDPTLENYWRAVILFGQNVASYKFALAKSLIELSRTGKQSITLEELAGPFSRHIVDHLAAAPKQATSASSRFLDTCKRFAAGDARKDKLIGQTVKLGFQNVIDAFHIVNRGEIPVRFFQDDRGNGGGIIFTDEFFRLRDRLQFGNLPQEVEARWRLVETAWQLRINRAALVVDVDSDMLVVSKGGAQLRARYQRSRTDARTRSGSIHPSVGGQSPNRSITSQAGGPKGMKTINGTLSTAGYHVAAKYLAHVVHLIEHRMGLTDLVPGTLNVSIPEDYIVIPAAVIHPHEYGHPETLKLQRCLVDGYKGIIMRPDTHETIPGYGHGMNHLELLGRVQFRDTLGLQDASPVKVEVEGDDAWWESGR